MNKTLTKALVILSCLAIQGCLVDISTRGPRPSPNPCRASWDCPVDTYCEGDGYCYEFAAYTECYSDFDCPIFAYCGLNGLCYEDHYRNDECYTSWDCPAHWYCAANGLCYQERYR